MRKALFASLLLLASTSRAEVTVVTPTNPIVLDQPLQTIGLDVDANGEVDFQFYYDVYLDEPFLHVNMPEAMQLNKVTVTGEQNQFAKDLVEGFGEGTLISENTQFNGAVFGNGPLLAQPTFAGDDILEGEGRRYIGIRFLRNGELHYGWLDLQVNGAGTTVTIFSYAWETSPSTAILTGLPANVGHEATQGLKLRKVGERVYEVTAEGGLVESVTVVDALGRTMLQAGGRVDLSGLPAGVYYLCSKAGRLKVSL